MRGHALQYTGICFEGPLSFFCCSQMPLVLNFQPLYLEGFQANVTKFLFLLVFGRKAIFLGLFPYECTSDRSFRRRREYVFQILGCFILNSLLIFFPLLFFPHLSLNFFPVIL